MNNKIVKTFDPRPKRLVKRQIRGWKKLNKCINNLSTRARKRVGKQAPIRN